MASIRVDDEGAVRTITLSNPDKRNALTRDMLAGLTDALRSIPTSAADNPRAVVLRGDPAGGAFSAGFDIRSIDAAERERGLDPIEAPASAIWHCPVPVIAALDGHAFGGALEIAAACHLRVASPSLRLGMPPARLGLVYSASGLLRFLRLCGPGQVARLFLGGETIDGAEAARIGLVEILDDDPVVRARSLAESMAANAPLAVRGMLESIQLLMPHIALTDDERSRLEALRAATVQSSDLLEGIAAFGEKRAPQFQGR